MKSPAFIGSLVFAVVTGAALAQVTPHPDILRYGVAKVRASEQTSLTTTVPLHYRFESFVEAQPGGIVNVARVQGPTISAQLIPRGTAGWNYRSNFYVNAELFDTDFPNFTNEPNGNYFVRIDHAAPNDGGFDFAVPFRFGSSSAYPVANPLVAIDGATFGDGGFVISSAHAAIFRFDFADYDPQTDFVELTIFDAQGDVMHRTLVQQTPAVPTFVEFAAHVFTAGAVYTGALTFGRVVDTSDTIAGAEGFAYFARETNFAFTAVAPIPEPAAAALIFGVGGLAILAFRRRALA